jgi:hypothetical protein
VTECRQRWAGTAWRWSDGARAAEMQGLLGPAPEGVDVRTQVQAMPEKEFFDCGTGSFYNYRVRKRNPIVAELTGSAIRKCRSTPWGTLAAL